MLEFGLAKSVLERQGEMTLTREGDIAGGSIATAYLRGSESIAWELPIESDH